MGNDHDLTPFFSNLYSTGLHVSPEKKCGNQVSGGYSVFFTDWMIEHDWHIRRSVRAKQRSVVRYAWNSLEKIWWPELPTKSTTAAKQTSWHCPVFLIFHQLFNHISITEEPIWCRSREAFRVSCQQHDKLVILELFAKKWLEIESTKER